MKPQVAQAFLFYYKDFLASTAAMSPAEVGAYMRLLCYQWEHGTIPNDERKVARIISGGTKAATLWRGIKDRFSILTEDGWQNAKLERVRAQLPTSLEDAGGNRRGFRNGTDSAQYVRTKPSISRSTSSTTTSASGDTLATESSNGDGGTSAAERFERFWAAYPRKVGRDAAWKEWLKRSPTNDLTDYMIIKIAEHRASPQWLRDGGQFIPHPRTWLSQGRWQDEADLLTPSTPARADPHGHIPPCQTQAECIAKRLGRTP
jgi:uncharacterized protein YdaU (DUF1376 family)